MAVENKNILRRWGTVFSTLWSSIKTRQWGAFDAGTSFDYSEGGFDRNEGSLIAKSPRGRMHEFLEKNAVKKVALAVFNDEIGTVISGTSGIIYKGVWSDAIYLQNDVVKYDGDLYIATKQILNGTGTPDSNSDWDVLLEGVDNAFVEIATVASFEDGVYWGFTVDDGVGGFTPSIGEGQQGMYQIELVSETLGFLARGLFVMGSNNVGAQDSYILDWSNDNISYAYHPTQGFQLWQGQGGASTFNFGIKFNTSSPISNVKVRLAEISTHEVGIKGMQIIGSPTLPTILPRVATGGGGGSSPWVDDGLGTVKLVTENVDQVKINDFSITPLSQTVFDAEVAVANPRTLFISYVGASNAIMNETVLSSVVDPKHFIGPQSPQFVGTSGSLNINTQAPIYFESNDPVIFKDDVGSSVTLTNPTGAPIYIKRIKLEDDLILDNMNSPIYYEELDLNGHTLTIGSTGAGGKIERVAWLSSTLVENQVVSANNWEDLKKQLERTDKTLDVIVEDGITVAVSDTLTISKNHRIHGSTILFQLSQIFNGVGLQFFNKVSCINVGPPSNVNFNGTSPLSFREITINGQGFTSYIGSGSMVYEKLLGGNTISGATWGFWDNTSDFLGASKVAYVDGPVSFKSASDNGEVSIIEAVQDMSMNGPSINVTNNDANVKIVRGHQINWSGVSIDISGGAIDFHNANAMQTGSPTTFTGTSDVRFKTIATNNANLNNGSGSYTYESIDGYGSLSNSTKDFWDNSNKNESSPIWMNSSETGLVDGFVITQNVNQVSIPSGQAHSIDNQGVNAVDPIGHIFKNNSTINVNPIFDAGGVDYFYLTSGSTYGVDGFKFDVVVRNDFNNEYTYEGDILLGLALHNGVDTVLGVTSAPVLGYGAANTLVDLYQYIGILRLGVEFSTRSGDLGIDQSAGTLFNLNINYGNNKNSPNNTVVVSVTDGSLSINKTTPSTLSVSSSTSIDQNQYWNGSALAAIPSNKWSIQRLFIGGNGLVYSQYAENYYNQISDAENAYSNGSDSLTVNPVLNHRPNAHFMGALFVQEGVSDLSTAVFKASLTPFGLGFATGASGGGGGSTLLYGSSAGITGSLSGSTNYTLTIPVTGALVGAKVVNCKINNDFYADIKSSAQDLNITFESIVTTAGQVEATFRIDTFLSENTSRKIDAVLEN